MKHSGVGRVTTYWVQPILSALRKNHADAMAFSWVSLRGTDRIFYARRDSLRLAEIEATARIQERNGRRRTLVKIQGTGVRWRHTPRRYAELLHPSRWREVDAEFGFGNRENPLAPFAHCAADQSLYPFGSRVQIRAIKRPDGGWKFDHAYVADTGDAITGELRIDLFVGFPWNAAAISREQLHVSIETPPDLGRLMNPKNPRGVQRLLNRIGDFHLAVDGIIGPLTRGALTRFQTDAGAVPPVEIGRAGGAGTAFHLLTAAELRDPAKARVGS